MRSCGGVLQLLSAATAEITATFTASTCAQASDPLPCVLRFLALLIGLTARYVSDWSDHVWTEYYSHRQRRCVDMVHNFGPAVQNTTRSMRGPAYSLGAGIYRTSCRTPSLLPLLGVALLPATFYRHLPASTPGSAAGSIWTPAKLRTTSRCCTRRAGAKRRAMWWRRACGARWT